MARVLVTGATGFVGRHLVRLLRERGDRVFGTCFPDHPGCDDRDLVHVDLRLEDGTERAVADASPEGVFHLAAVSNVRRSWERRRETIETNLLGTSNLFEAVRKRAPSARVLFLSSSDVYGVHADRTTPFREEDAASVVNPYSFTKVAGELLSRFYVQVEKLDIVVARSFPHTGPGQTADFVFSDWASQVVRIERGEAPPFLEVGNLDVRRDYSDVRDIVRAYALLLEKSRRGETYNVCSGRTVSLREGLEELIGLARRPIEVRQDPARLRKTDIPFLAGDGSKLRRETGWAPEIPFSRTLGDLLEFWRRESEAGGGSGG
ncbi:MAG: GDP-mannose 4,6-dehydratase [Candidatus Aminicenantes bacterium]|nr:GDP-mannose 4,6-dehydratase [Candidatus Aminicenantes bacterium]